ncbi:MAG TPA: serine/threonine-protein kinase [Gemmatimonadaceae bacterium]|nr:serine/threonine-protein kinase [Gemmatimonadaceae bacterium]
MAESTQTMIPEQEVREALAPNYILEKELGRGGMGAVYLARDVRLDRPVAIKFLPPDMAMREDLRARFLQETRTAASFSHPNIVPVHAIEESERILCFVMGYVDGETLTARVKRAGPMTAADATRFLQEAAWALSYAHGRGIVHRDVKPDNILIDRGSGRAMVTDFGIARSQDTTSGLTQVGEIIGTPQYMSPEQATGESIDARSDLYSLGVVAFFALTGRLPFESSTSHGYLTAHITRPAPSMSSVRPDLPPALSNAVDRLLQKDAAQRFQKGEELAEALDPLRASRREIPPAIRLFQVKSTQVIRNALIFLLLGPSLSRSAGGEGDQLILLVIVLSAAFALVLQAIGGLRELAAQGFSHDDLRNGVVAISEEENEARAQMRAAPDWAERRKRQSLRLAVSIVIGIALVLFSLSTRVPRPQGGYTTPLIGFAAAALGAMIVIISVVYAAASGGASARLDRKLRALWTGPIGRKLYERVQKSIARSRPAVRVVSAELGPLTLIEELPKNVRRDLGDVARVISSLVSAQKDLVDRESRLASSQMEASRGSAGVATDTLDRVITELTEAKQAAVERRDEITTALERIRLEVIRLRSGVGTVADVIREADKAKDLT